MARLKQDDIDFIFGGVDERFAVMREEIVQSHAQSVALALAKVAQMQALAGTVIDVAGPLVTLQFDVDVAAAQKAVDGAVPTAIPTVQAYALAACNVGDRVKALHIPPNETIVLGVLGGASSGGGTGGNLVTSVNGEQGDVVLTSADIGAIAASVASAFGLSLLGTASPSGAQALLGLGTAATHNTPASGDAAPGEVVLGSDSRLGGGGGGGTLPDPVTIPHGGTGATTALAALSALGGQTHDADLDAISALTHSRGDLLVAGATDWQLLHPSNVGEVPQFNGTDSILRVMRGQADGGKVASNSSAPVTLQNADFTLAGLKVGNVYRVRAFGTYLNNSGGNISPVVTLKIGPASSSVTVLALQVTSPVASNASARGFVFEFDVQILALSNAGNTIAAGGLGWFTTAASQSPGSSSLMLSDSTAGVAVDTSGASLKLAIYGTPGANANANFTVRSITMVQL